MKIYIIGPTLKDDKATNQKIDAAVLQAYSEGNQPVDTSKLNDILENDMQKIARVRVTLLLRCKSVYVIPGWEKDELAKAELFIALLLKMPVHYEGHMKQPLDLTLSHKPVSNV